MPSDKALLFLLPDCPGDFTELVCRMGKALEKQGFVPLFAATSPFYDRFKKVNLSAVGQVYYLDEFLSKPIPEETYMSIPVSHWSGYASHSRQSYYYGRPLNNLETLKKTKLFFQTIYNQHRVVLQISEGVSNSFLYLAHEQGAKNNIRYFGYMGARLPYTFNVHLDVVGNEVLLNPEAPKEYSPTNELPDYMKNSQFGGLFDRKQSLLSFGFLKEMLEFVFSKRTISLESGNTKQYLLKVYKISLRRILADFYFSKMTSLFASTVPFNPDKIYIVYPLHFYPEASTSILAKYYDGNEYNLIKNIAFSLPENCVLVVKEHKMNVGNNSKAFYKKIKQLPNVLLLTPYYKLKDNLEKFDAVVTLSSTVGFEALTMDVPVYALAEIFYQNYPGCTKINSYAELEKKLANIKKRTKPAKKNQTFNLYAKLCFPGSFNYLSPDCLNEQNVELLVKPALDYLKTGTLLTHRNDEPINNIESVGKKTFAMAD